VSPPTKVRFHQELENILINTPYILLRLAVAITQLCLAIRLERALKNRSIRIGLFLQRRTNLNKSVMTSERLKIPVQDMDWLQLFMSCNDALTFLYVMIFSPRTPDITQLFDLFLIPNPGNAKPDRFRHAVFVLWLGLIHAGPRQAVPFHFDTFLSLHASCRS
jgi:hypothetical protein